MCVWCGEEGAEETKRYSSSVFNKSVLQPRLIRSPPFLSHPCFHSVFIRVLEFKDEDRESLLQEVHL